MDHGMRQGYMDRQHGVLGIPPVFIQVQEFMEALHICIIHRIITQVTMLGISMVTSVWAEAFYMLLL